MDNSLNGIGISFKDKGPKYLMSAIKQSDGWTLAAPKENIPEMLLQCTLLGH